MDKFESDNQQTMDITRLCACGCGQELVKSAGTTRAQFLRQRYLKDHHYGHQECQSKRAQSIKEAHARGAFAAGHIRRREKTLASRPRCECGCGKPVSAKGVYASGCVDVPLWIR